MKREIYEVSIVTQVSIDRLERLSWMADKWRAPISAAVYIKDDSDIDHIISLIRSSYAVTQFVDIHLLYANNTRYPINTLRNLSIKHAETEWVLLMDADFVPPIYLYQNLKVPKTNLTAFVVPSFASDLERFELPDDKDTLLSMVLENEIFPTNVNVCSKCHAPSNYSRWYTETQPYTAKYKWIYEPYLVFRPKQVEPFDERLKGYGFDKNSHTFGMAVQGYEFIVLPSSWIVHINHPAKVWEGTDTYSEQMFDSLKVVCDSILPDTKIKYGYKADDQLFSEPISKKVCHSRDHW
ncbi:hypothetical protein SAMD00019534_012790 [Acytostelium subglobosum LB1]|uniref:hypothetical protein n=1 Tax=Acytostelium subglobosum LB1 TaxID=1410327 RepID=UPI0006451822|nr:hypothetical protein SAMD00019534_012790 [Acytostelium subglobosum LB1]GAM18104.1 hypothetical protein SAMD00019534_012790 [Acytostelium subglobosum LB1]|eukprot:XP_012758700.1 hypothetical protein SAMD00019534_012790 [Acytostelium subglobosum LB1]